MMERNIINSDQISWANNFRDGDGFQNLFGGYDKHVHLPIMMGCFNPLVPEFCFQFIFEI